MECSVLVKIGTFSPQENIYFVPSDCEFVGQIGNGGVDHGFWGRPEEMTMDRFDDDDSYDDGDDDDDGAVDDDDDDGDRDGDGDGDDDDADDDADGGATSAQQSHIRHMHLLP